MVTIRKTVVSHFNPRSPHGERRGAAAKHQRQAFISIHAPRTGSDTTDGRCCAGAGYFNPRSPHGERLSARLQSCLDVLISIHAPRTGSDVSKCQMLINPIISIHAPRTGSDSIKSISAFISLHFNPRSPHGERQRCVFGMASGGYFNPRSPHGERPANAAALPSCICISIHAPRTGSDCLSQRQE